MSNAGETNPWNASFDMYGTLGDPTNFYSFHNIATMLTQLESGTLPIAVPDSFNVEIEDGGVVDGTEMVLLIGQDLGIWLVDENIYIKLTFTDWGQGAGGSVAYTRSTRNTVGINEIKNTENIEITPSVSNNYIKVSGISDSQSYKIFNITGAEILSGTINPNQNISIENFTSGVYILKLESGKASKFIKY